MYPQKGQVGKDVVTPITCRDPRKKVKVDDHRGTLYCRVLSPSGTKTKVTAEKVWRNVGSVILSEVT